MKIRARITFETVIDETNFYNELIENGYLPDAAVKTILNREREELERIDNRAANIFYTPYEVWYDIKELENTTE